ncbi:hypothetical protein M5689_005430 [Euphorbia peplus]|nr:hypothetical protein M5689_005430 [Euphorbia peplus]
MATTNYEVGIRFEQEVVYEWIPSLCSLCKQVGHVVKNCSYTKKQVWKPKNQPEPIPQVSKPTEFPSLTDPIVARSPTIVAHTSNNGRIQSTNAKENDDWSIVTRSMKICMTKGVILGLTRKKSNYQVEVSSGSTPILRITKLHIIKLSTLKETRLTKITSENKSRALNIPEG